MTMFTRRAAIAVAIALTATPSAVLADIPAAAAAFMANSDAITPPASDAAKVALTYAEDAVILHPMKELPGGPLKGLGSIEGFFAGFDTRFSEVTHTETHSLVSGNRAVIEGTIQGTYRESGEPFQMTAVFSLTFDEEGRVTEQRTYFRPEQATE